ncbi:MAG: PRC-barrel domain-containing protein [Burkholderiaceae bacterium]
MLNRVHHLDGATVTASDGLIGHLKDVFFDDAAWAIRYLVVDTGTWLTGRQVLISPYSVKSPLSAASNIDVRLTRKEIAGSPDVDVHMPVSRQHESEVVAYYGYPDYWGAGGLWGMGGYPIFPVALPTAEQLAIDKAARAARAASADGCLRSAAHVKGYDIHATDGNIGHVTDFLFDDETWALRYFVVDTRNWWPGGTRVLIAPHWIASVDWAQRSVHVKITKSQVKSSPVYEEGEPVHRDYERRLYDAYDRTGYWD